MVVEDLPAAAGGTAYRLEIELLTTDGRRLRRFAVEPDWEPVYESTRFDAVRRGLLPPLLEPFRGSVEPQWHGTLGAPYVSGFRVTVMTAHGRTSAPVPLEFLAPLTRAAAAEVVAAGAAEATTSLLFLARAYAEPLPVAAHPFAVEAVAEDLDLRYAPLSRLRERGVALGCAAAADMPVFVEQRVVDDAMAMARAAATVEVGGVLIGELCRDPEVCEVFLRVSALIPARHTVAAATKVTFTAETWADVDAAVAAAGGARKLGWFHYHPCFCAACPEEKRADCSLGEPFFSADDAHLHRVCFSRAYHVALLITDTPRRGLVPTMYGWRGGVVCERDFHCLPDDTGGGVAAQRIDSNGFARNPVSPSKGGETVAEKRGNLPGNHPGELGS